MIYTTKIRNAETIELLIDVNIETAGIESIEYAETVRRQLEKINKRPIKMEVSGETITYSFDK